jgi:glycosyltransferase involved in cell wall biosynthesis
MLYMPDNPYFSIVIPTYNRAAFITRALKSVLRQSVSDFEIVVVDDGSTDDTRSIVGKIQDARLRYFKTENCERAAARNFGIKQSDGKFVTFLDSDDYLKPNHFEEALVFLAKNPDTQMFSLGYDVVQTDDAIIYPWKPLPDPVNEKLVEGNFLSCMGVFVRRDIFNEILFNEDRALSGSEDYELWLRLAARYPIRTISTSTACLVNHDSRSVVSINANALMRRITLLKDYISADAAVKRYYGDRLLQVKAYLDVYLALHLAMAASKKQAFQALMHAAFTHKPVVGNKRFWVVIKKIIFD